MVAALSTLLVFLFLTLLGKAVIEALAVGLSILRSWLLAPSVGLATVVLLTLNINQAGFPVQSFASLLALALGVFIGVVFWWRRPVLPWKQLSPFLGAAIFAFLYACWPMFRNGFRWYGYMNGDMALYVLDAARMMRHGFYQMPTLQELNGTDYSQYMWFHFAAGLFRCGADVFLAWFASLAHWQPLQVSMPATGAADMVQIWSAAGLVLTRISCRRLALTTALLMAASPFYILGVMAQLLPQVGGLALLFCLCALCMRPLQPSSGCRSVLPNVVLISAVGSASAIYYPEVLPFGALAIAGYHGWLLMRRRESISSLAATGIPALILLAVFARQGIFTAVGTILMSLSAATNSGATQATDFDRVLDPSIFASLPGLAAYYGQHHDPWVSIGIALGAVMLTTSLWIGFRYAWKGEPAAFLLLIMLALGIRLFLTHAAFGVFKLAMYIQPVFLFSLGIVTVRVLGKKWYLAPALYLPATMAAATLYVSTSIGSNVPATLPGIDNAEVRPLLLGGGKEIVVSSLNEVGAALYAAESTGMDVKWADYNYFFGATAMNTMAPRFFPLPSQLGLTRDYLTPAVALRRRFDVATEAILGHELRKRAATAQEPVSYLGSLARDQWISSNHGFRDVKDDKNYFSFSPIDQVNNYVVLLATSLGGSLGLGSSKVSRWPPEIDLYNLHGTFYGVGRHLLFEVIRPTAGMRLRISLSRTLSGAGRTTLPESAEVHAGSNQRLGFVGSGAANLVTPPLQLYERSGRFYFALDFGTDGSYFPNRKTGLLRMFHSDIPIDNRQMVGFVRDMAVVTESQYRDMERPTSITSWPSGLLANPNLEFSGIYEDGWISNRAFVVLGNAKAGEQLHITGLVPGLPRFATLGNGLCVLLNGKLIYKNRLKAGHFEVSNTLTADSTENRVDFLFDQMDRLPGGDDRPVSAQLFQIAVRGGAAGATASQQKPLRLVRQPSLSASSRD